MSLHRFLADAQLAANFFWKGIVDLRQIEAIQGDVALLPESNIRAKIN